MKSIPLLLTVGCRFQMRNEHDDLDPDIWSVVDASPGVPSEIDGLPPTKVDEITIHCAATDQTYTIEWQEWADSLVRVQ